MFNFLKFLFTSEKSFQDKMHETLLQENVLLKQAHEHMKAYHNYCLEAEDASTNLRGKSGEKDKAKAELDGAQARYATVCKERAEAKKRHETSCENCDFHLSTANYKEKEVSKNNLIVSALKKLKDLKQKRRETQETIRKGRETLSGINPAVSKAYSQLAQASSE
ncbi:MAG: hypothetical protein KAR24_00805 [Candidatus Pacebacteria bacterium]|nr:hypothetical protein [Candidatus Paceibacterota bacterium]